MNMNKIEKLKKFPVERQKHSFENIPGHFDTGTQISTLLQKNSHLLVVPVLVHKKFKKTLFQLYFDIFLKVKNRFSLFKIITCKN